MITDLSGTDEDEIVENLKRKYLKRREQLSSTEKTNATKGRASHKKVHGPKPDGQSPVGSPRSKCTARQMRGYNRALQELFQAVTNGLDTDLGMSGSDEDQSEEDTTLPPQENQAHYTETDVSLPSSLNGTMGSQGTGPTEGGARGDMSRERARALLLSHSSPVTSSGIGQVYHEMMHIYDQLKTERQNQQEWELELQERESRLLQRKEALSSIGKLEQEVHARILDVQQSHQQEMQELQKLLQERTKENRRLRSSFDTIKELNNTTKTQLSEVCDQNRKLETQSRKVQARLENLQRKYEFSMAQRGHDKPRVKAADPRLSKPERTAAVSAKPSKGSASPAPPRLLVLLLDWVLDGQEVKGQVSTQGLAPAVLLHERFSKVLPLLADQLQQTSGSESALVLPLLRFILWTLRQMDNNTQTVTLSSTLRRIGEELTRPPSVPQSPGPPEPRGSPRASPLYRSPCSHTSLLSALIILKTVVQADVLAQVLDSLHSGLVCVETRGLFLHYGGLGVLLALLRAGRGSLYTSIDILLLLTSQSRFMEPFLEACSCEEFFRTASLLLKSPRVTLPWMEKVSILLQKLSNIRKNRRFFELTSLHLQIQELQRTTNPTNTFLCLNLGSILINLK